MSYLLYCFSSSYPMDFDGSMPTASESMFLSDYYDDNTVDNNVRRHRDHRDHRDRSPLTISRR